MVSFDSALMRYFPVASSDATQILQLALGNKSPGPVEHKNVTHFNLRLSRHLGFKQFVEQMVRNL